MILNKIAAITLFIIIFFLLRNVFRNKTNGRSDIMIENINTFSAAVLLFIMAIGFLTTNNPFCELVPFFCR